MGSNLQTATTVASYDNRWIAESRPMDEASAGDQLVRRLVGINATNVDDLMVALEAKKIYVSTDAGAVPIADQQTFSGNWVNSSLRKVHDRERGQTIEQVLTKVTDITTEANLPTDVIISPRNPTTFKPFSIEEGTGTNLTYTYLWLNPNNAATIETMTLTPPSGYVEKDRNVIIQEAGDRTATLVVLYRKVSWTAVQADVTKAASLRRIDGGLSEDNEFEQQTQVSDGVPNSTAPTITLALSTATTSTTQPSNASFQELGNGECRVVQLNDRIGEHNSAVGTLAIGGQPSDFLSDAGDDELFNQAGTTVKHSLTDEISFSVDEDNPTPLGRVVRVVGLTFDNAYSLGKALVDGGSDPFDLLQLDWDSSTPDRKLTLFRIRFERRPSRLVDVVVTFRKPGADDNIRIGVEELVMLNMEKTQPFRINAAITSNGVEFEHAVFRTAYDSTNGGRSAAISYGNLSDDEPSGYPFYVGKQGGWVEQVPGKDIWFGYKEKWVLNSSNVGETGFGDTNTRADGSTETVFD